MALSKKLFLVLVLFSSLATFGVYYIYYYEHSNLEHSYVNRWKTDDPILDNSSNEQDEENDDEFLSFCPKLSLTDEKFQENHGVKCKRHRPTIKGCKYAKNLFSKGLPSEKCKGIPYREICNVEFSIQNKVAISCSEDICKNEIDLLILNQDNGHLERTQTFSSVEKLQKQLPQVIQDSLDKNIKFCVITCRARGADIKQLIQFPVIKMKQMNLEKSKNKINVNLIFLDSVSRPHFYRSLPLTIDYFRKVNAQPEKHKGKIYDFELFQAVKGRTYETIHALFTGDLLPIKNPFLPKTKPVGLDVMFKKYKDNGYYTLYQEDLCWTAQWGIMDDLRISGFSTLIKKLPQIAVDEMGITHSSCTILKENGVKLPFHGPAEICFNGKYQTEYFFQYIQNMLHSARKTSNRLFSVGLFNIGHESSAKRIQLIDKSLVETTENLLKEHQDTITIIVADHGNTYSTYTEQIQEGMFEIFNPILFMVVPDKVAQILGEERMLSLALNQKRLGSVIDLHHTLMSLAAIDSTRIKKHGYLEKINKNRTCDDLEMLQPNLCVCEGWDMPVTAEFKGADAEFAVGMLNNMIQDQFTNGSQSEKSTFGHCRRLKPSEFKNIRTRRMKSGRVVVSMDIAVAAGNVVKQETDIFHVEVSSIQEHDSTSKDMKLDIFSRITEYGLYKECADPGVALTLCICSKKNGLIEASSVDWKHYGLVFGRETNVRTIYNNCLLLLYRIITNNGKGMNSAGIELANTCEGKTFDVTVDLSASNMKVSSKSPISIRLQPGAIKFVASAVKVVWYNGVSLQYKITLHLEGRKIYQTDQIKL